ncbi:MAG: T9SS type A sorting domain-containing protein [Bacteroidota bacterium]
MKPLYILLLLLLAGSVAPAQESHRFDIPRAGTVDVAAVEVDYFPHLQRLQKPFPGGSEAMNTLEAVKQQQEAKYGGRTPDAPANKQNGGALEPWMGRNFRSNIAIQGVPNDNDLAVGGNFVLSVINSNIWMHDRDGNTLKTISLEAWSDTLNVSQDQFDPRALYDPRHDRFIIVCLSGFTSTTNNIVVGFSATNDPTGDWNLYALPGDPLNDTLWTDYPIIALTEYELFVTGNLLRNGEPWQTGFDKSICWQIDLDNGYAGDTLETRLWERPTFGGAPIRNLCPVQGGVLPYGPNLYLLSNRNFAASNDTVFVMEITDTLNGNPQYTVDFALADVPYSVPTNAPQVISQRLATNDARWLDAFIENDNIQFVGNCTDTITGLPGVYHGIIPMVSTSSPLTVTANVLRDDSVGYGYGGITWFGLSYTDNDALIGVSYSGPYNTKHPGCGVIYSNGQGLYSDLVIARRGSGFINAISDTLERWGDYSGMQLDYGPTLGRAWMAGTWGQSSHIPATWVAEFNHPGIVSRPETPPTTVDANAFPNPFTDLVGLEFRLEHAQAVDIALYDLQGRKVETLLRTQGKAGLNRFTFSQQPLPSGIYFLRITGEQGQLATKKVVKQ